MLYKGVYMKKKSNEAVQNVNGRVQLSIVSIVLPVIMGTIIFLLIYGFVPLNVTNDRWILSGYDESDIIQHYAGWLAYRNSDWKLPLGMTDCMSVGTGTIISYTDSIPIVAIISKVFRNVLPETFQYFGIYTLLCYILQSIAAFKLIFFKTHNITYSFISIFLFAFSPILIERAFRHTALGSQWLILFAIYIYLKYFQCDIRGGEIKYCGYLFLEILAIGIHPYFLPMVAVFALLSAIDDVRKKRYIAILYLIGIQIVTYIFGMIIGVLGNGISPSRDGYGFYSMNMNAIINPISCGQYTWSVLLKTHPQILGNYDGFNYLGAGVLIFIIILVLLTVLLNKQFVALELLKKHIFLFVVSIFLTCFAISNVVTFNDVTLCTVPLPQFIEDICGIFRASSRLFYPVYYIIFCFSIILLWRLLDAKKNYVCGLLIFIVVLQLFDIHSCIIEKHKSMNEKKNYISYIEDSGLDEIAIKGGGLLLEEYYEDSRTLAVWAFKNNMRTYYWIANSGNYDKTAALSQEILANCKVNGDIGRNIIVTTSSENADFYRQFDLGIYEIEGNYFIYKDEKQSS